MESVRGRAFCMIFRPDDWRRRSNYAIEKSARPDRSKNRLLARLGILVLAFTGRGHHGSLNVIAGPQAVMRDGPKWGPKGKRRIAVSEPRGARSAMGANKMRAYSLQDQRI